MINIIVSNLFDCVMISQFYH